MQRMKKVHVCDAVEVMGEVYEPPAKKYSIHPSSLTNGGSALNVSSYHDITVKFEAEPVFKVCDHGDIVKNEFKRSCDKSSNSLGRQSIADFYTSIPKKLKLDEHVSKSFASYSSNSKQTCADQAEGSVYVHRDCTDLQLSSKNFPESATVIENSPILQNYTGAGVNNDKLSCDSFREFCSKLELTTIEPKNMQTGAIISANDPFSPKMSYKGASKCQLTPHLDDFLHNNSLCKKQDTQESDILDYVSSKSSSPAAEALNKGFDCLIESIADCDNNMKILDIISHKPCTYPSPSVLNWMLRTLIEVKSNKLRRYSTFKYLKTLLVFLPPDRTSHYYYYNALYFQNEFTWEEICEVIESALQPGNEDDNRNSCDVKVPQIDFLKLFVTILAKDCETSPQKYFLRQWMLEKQPFVNLVFFVPDNTEQRKLQILLRFINILAARPSLSNWQVDLLSILMRLLHLFAETVQKKCDFHVYSALGYDKLNFITNEISVHCRDVLGDMGRSKIFLNMLSPPWLQVKVAENLMAKLISSSPLHCFELPTTLRKIVRQYIFPPSEKLRSAKEKALSTKEGGYDENSDHVSQNHIMKRNHKGETLIHAYCIKNKPEALEEILSVPGIDINVRDYAGWTPLHECCNYGRIDCTKLLLSWFPAEERYATVFSEHLTGADLCASNDGTTALHEAVSSNHVEIAQLLLEYGGPSLLNLKDNQGKTPYDLVTNVMMMGVLDDARHDTAWKRKQRFDEENFNCDGDWSYSKRVCPTFRDSSDWGHYAYLLDIILQGYMCINDLVLLKKFVQKAKKDHSSDNLKLVVEKFFIGRNFTPDIHCIVNCLDDLFVLQSLPKILEAVSDCSETADADCTALDWLLSLKLQLSSL